MVVFGESLGFLFLRPASVFQSLCELCLWSQSSSRCCFHSDVLCSWMSESMFAFMAGSVGSLWLVCLMVLRCAIRSLMFCGSSLCLLCIFPFGIWCLSALSMMLMIVLLAW